MSPVTLVSKFIVPTREKKSVKGRSKKSKPIRGPGFVIWPKKIAFGQTASLTWQDLWREMAMPAAPIDSRLLRIKTTPFFFNSHPFYPSPRPTIISCRENLSLKKLPSYPSSSSCAFRIIAHGYDCQAASVMSSVADHLARVPLIFLITAKVRSKRLKEWWRCSWVRADLNARGLPKVWR